MNNCPQCEDVPITITCDEGVSIKCEFCGFQTRFVSTEFEAIQKWEEVWELIDMRSSMMAQTLIGQPKEKIDSYLRLCSLNIIAQYLQICYDEGRDWETFKGSLFQQIKITELSYDRIRKKIKKFTV